MSEPLRHVDHVRQHLGPRDALERRILTGLQISQFDDNFCVRWSLHLPDGNKMRLQDCLNLLS